MTPIGLPALAQISRCAGSTVEKLQRQASEATTVALALNQIGLLRPVRPDQAAGMLLALSRWGMTPAGGYAVMALRHPIARAIVDEDGALSFEEVHRRTTALANGLAGEGLGEGDNVGVLTRNHRGFVEATVALSKLGANALYLNTAFAGPQLAEVLRAEEVTAVVYDEEFVEQARSGFPGGRRFVVRAGSEGRAGGAQDPTLDALVAAGNPREPTPPGRPGRQVILTSGTTGRPKGASRSTPNTLDPLIGLLSRIPLRRRDTTLIAAPLFHAWGFGNLTMSLVSGATVVLQRHFDAESTLAAIEEHKVTVLAAVPVMIQRIMELPEAVRRRYDTSSLRVVALSGSSLPPDVARAFMDSFGEVLYSLYGSTEAGWVAIATPDDLRAAPGTAGFPPRGASVRIVDDKGSDVPVDQTGRIFVASELLFEGYTAGGSKETLGNSMATGDLGHFDECGRLFVDGREDDMIVSGGENVFPQEIEDLIRSHHAVADVSVVGVPDERWGQRLEAFVVAEHRDPPSVDELKSYVRANLSRYKVPRDVLFVDRLPRTSTGKVVKDELIEATEDQRHTPTSSKVSG